MIETQKNMWITGSVAFLVGALVGVFSAYSIPFNSANTYQAGFSAAKTLVEKSSIAPLIGTNADVHTLSGIVSAVSGNGFTLHIQSIDPFANPALADRTVLIGSSPSIVKLVQKDPKTFQSEMDAYTKATQAGGSASQAPPPASFTTAPASISDLVAGGFVTVIATEDVSSLKEFPATQIQVQGNTATPVR